MSASSVGSSSSDIDTLCHVCWNEFTKDYNVKHDETRRTPENLHAQIVGNNGQACSEIHKACFDCAKKMLLKVDTNKKAICPDCRSPIDPELLSQGLVNTVAHIRKLQEFGPGAPLVVAKQMSAILTMTAQLTKNVDELDQSKMMKAVENTMKAQKLLEIIFPQGVARGQIHN